MTVNDADGDSERIAADYPTLTGESGEQEGSQRFADVPLLTRTTRLRSVGC